MQTKTLKLRIKDKHRNELNRQARQVNFAWNYINELSSRSIRELYNRMAFGGTPHRPEQAA